MRVGIDVDGILSNFTQRFAELLITVTERKLIDPATVVPVVWNWPQHYGYTEEEVARVWTVVKADTVFWASLDALPGADDFLKRLDESQHEVYFITDRPGIGPQVQTQYWLAQHGYWGPNVIISRKGKGVVCDALSLEVYIDDKSENLSDCWQKSPSTLLFTLDYPYNKDGQDYAQVTTLEGFAEEIEI